jgi:hypothetical protein
LFKLEGLELFSICTTLKSRDQASKFFSYRIEFHLSEGFLLFNILCGDRLGRIRGSLNLFRRLVGCAELGDNDLHWRTWCAADLAVRDAHWVLKCACRTVIDNRHFFLGFLGLFLLLGSGLGLPTLFTALFDFLVIRCTVEFVFREVLL